jgi:GNAT superfamily N-acetyltransferase
MKSFKEFLLEMTNKKMQEYPFPDFSNAQHIGDIEHNKIIHKNVKDGVDLYAITVDEKPVCYIQSQIKVIRGESYEDINFIQVLPEFRDQDLAKKLIFFLKTHLKKSLLLGDRQSESGRAFARSLYKSQRFNMFWINTKTGEKHSYDAQKDLEKDKMTLSPYRSWGDVTGWQIMIEALQETKQERFLDKFEDQWKKYLIHFD